VMEVGIRSAYGCATSKFVAGAPTPDPGMTPGCEPAAERSLKGFTDAGRLERVDIARSASLRLLHFSAVFSTATNRQAGPRSAGVQMATDKPQTRGIGAFYSSPQ
jgi:hypothetical protein